MANYTTDDIYRILDGWIKDGVDPYWIVDRYAGGRLVHKVTMVERGRQVRAEGATQVEATIKAMAELRGYIE